MEQTVYGDLLFLINFSMDFLCLFLVARLLAKPFSLPRTVLAAALGGIYSVTALFLTLGAWGRLADLLVCVLICAVAFGDKREGWSSLALLSGAFVLASMLLGGVMTAIFNLMNRADPPLDSFADDDSIPLWLFALVTAAASLITWIGGRFLRRRGQIPEAQVEIQLGGRKTVIRAMCDSGNLLRDTVSGKPVIVSDIKNAVNLLPVDCAHITEWNADTVQALPPPLAARVRLIPTSSVGADGILLALRPDSVVIRVGNRTRSADALIGFAKIRCALPTCSAILPPELLT